MNEKLRRSCSASALILSINGRLIRIRRLVARTSSCGSLRIRGNHTEFTTCSFARNRPGKLNSCNG